MRRINKGAPPPELVDWISANPNGVYKDLDRTEAGRDARRAIRCAALAEQGCLCAYCCARIDGSTSHNDHVLPQSTAPNQTADFTNIVASCNIRNQCGDAHGNQHLPLTPFVGACETDLRYSLSGKVQGTNNDATETIRVLNLDSRLQRGVRQTMVNALIFAEGAQPDELTLLDDDLLEAIKDSLQREDRDGCLVPYAPVLTNIISQLLVA